MIACGRTTVGLGWIEGDPLGRVEGDPLGRVGADTEGMISLCPIYILLGLAKPFAWAIA